MRLSNPYANAIIQFDSDILRHILGLYHLDEKVKLAAYSISSQMVLPSSFFSSQTKWSKLRDSSICLLVNEAAGLQESDSGADRFYVQVPYSLFVDIVNFSPIEKEQIKSECEQAFIEKIVGLHENVDAVLFDLQPWQLMGKIWIKSYIMEYYCYVK